MSRLVLIHKGKIVKSLPFPEGGLRFGRHQCNNLVLAGENVPLFWGKFYVDSNDGAIWLTRFTADGSHYIDSSHALTQPLEENQTLQIGQLCFKVLPDNAEQYIKKVVTPITREIPLPNHSSIANKAFGLVALFLAICLLVTVSFVDRSRADSLFCEQSKAGSLRTLNYAQENSLVFFYQQLNGNDEHMIRYSLELNLAGMLSIELYDLITGYAISYEKLIPVDDFRNLFSNAYNSEVYCLEDKGDLRSSNTRDGDYFLANIVLNQHGIHQEVNFFNDAISSYLMEIVEDLEGFAELSSPSLSGLTTDKLATYLAHKGSRSADIFSEHNSSNKRLDALMRQLKDAEDHLASPEPSSLFYRIVGAQQQVLSVRNSCEFTTSIFDESQNATRESKRSTTNYSVL